jgi:hypothetical protein
MLKQILAPLVFSIAILTVMLTASRQSMRVFANGNADRNAAAKTARKTSFGVIPAGTKIHVRLEGAISSEASSRGESFQALLDAPLLADGQVVAPKRAKIVGAVTEVTAARAATPQVTMVLNQIVVGGRQHPVVTHPLTLLGKSTAMHANPRRRKTVGRSAGELIAYGPESRFSFTLAQPLRLPLHYR